MTDEEIIVSLKGSILNAKRIKSKCWSIEIYKLKNALDLINRQRTEIERLEKELQRSEQEADITETILEERNKDIYDLIFKERSNAILEFVEALKQETDDDFVFMDIIDDLVKEMTEVEK